MIIIYSFSLISCNESSSHEVSYSHDIQPIFYTRCTSCHGPNGSANLDLSSFETMMSKENDNPDKLVVPGYADQSLLYQKVAFPSEEQTFGDRMPFGEDQLESSYIRVIEDWIKEGARDN